MTHPLAYGSFLCRMSEPLTYRFATFQELVDRVPSDRIAACLRELAIVLQEGKLLAELMQATAESLGMAKQPAGRVLELPEELEWIDDGKGDLDLGFQAKAGDESIPLFNLKMKVKSEEGGRWKG